MDALSFNRIIAPELPAKPAGPPAESPAESPGGSFAELLGDAVQRVRDIQAESDTELRRLLAGEPVDLHRVLLAGEQAGLASELMVAVRNKMVDAYQEVMRIQV
jgi:flagellar hook-basal body complex protein FliE